MAHGVGRSSSPAVQATRGAKPSQSRWERPRDSGRSPLRTWSDLAPPSRSPPKERQQRGAGGAKAPSPAPSRRRASSAAAPPYSPPTPTPQVRTPPQGGWMDVPDGYAMGLLSPEALSFDLPDGPVFSPLSGREPRGPPAPAQPESCPPSPPPEYPITHLAYPAADADASVESTGTQADPLACLQRGPIERLPIPPSGRKPVEFYARLAAAGPGSATFDGQFRPAHFLPPTDFPAEQITPPSVARHRRPEMWHHSPSTSPRGFPDGASSSQEWVPAPPDDQRAYHPTHGHWVDLNDVAGTEFPSYGQSPASPHHWRSPTTPSPSRPRRAAEPKLSAAGQVIYGECQECHLVEPVPHGWLPDHYWDVGVLRWCAACGCCTTWLGLETDVRPAPFNTRRHTSDRSWSDVAAAANSDMGW
eukprot:EG_transcript_14373